MRIWTLPKEVLLMCPKVLGPESRCTWHRGDTWVIPWVQVPMGLVHVGKDSLMMLGLRAEWLIDYCMFPVVLQQTAQT